MTRFLRLCAIAALAVGAWAGGCEPPGPLQAYCDNHAQCFGSYDAQDCLAQLELQEPTMIQRGPACHEAFLAFHECMGLLSCDALDDYYSSHLWCGVEDDAYAAECFTF